MKHPNLELLRLEKAKREKRRNDLNAILKRIVKPKEGGLLLLSTLQRTLHLFGVKVDNAELVPLMAEVFHAKDTRVSQSDRRRAFRDVEIRVDLDAARTAVARKWAGRADADDQNPADRRFAKAVAADWEQRLAAEGMPAKLPAAERDVSFERVCIDSAYFARCRNYLYNHRWSANEALDKEVWTRHALDGASIDDIAHDLGLDRNQIDRLIVKHRARMGWRFQ